MHCTCRVDTQLAVRVGDFGLARDVYSRDYYRANQGARIPVKWMPPETLLDSISNEKTDVVNFFTVQLCVILSNSQYKCVLFKTDAGSQCDAYIRSVSINSISYTRKEHNYYYSLYRIASA